MSLPTSLDTKKITLEKSEIKTTAEKKFINDLLGLMESYKADYTNTFLGLTLDKASKDHDYLILY